MKVVYQYLDNKGRRRMSWQEAESVAVCCTLLASCGIYPLHIVGLAMPKMLQKRGMTSRQLAIFFRQLSIALSSGVPLLDALHYMQRSWRREHQRAFILRLEKGILAGQPFSSVLRREKGVAALLSQWIAIGEKQGKLAQVLDEVFMHLERQERLKKRIQQQLLYPGVVLLAVLLVGAVLSLVVMPMMAQQFMSTESEVPVLMRFFMLTHDVLVNDGLVIFFVLVCGIAGGYWWYGRGKKQPTGAGWLKRLVLQIPFVNKYFLLKTYVPFARLFGQLLRSGVSASEALEELRSYFSRSLFADDIAAVHETMLRGGKLAQAIAQTPFVPEMAQQMLLNGEHNGRLTQALTESADYYETVLMEELSLWIRFVEPLAIVLLGILVLFMALGLFMPLLESYQSLLAQ